MTTKGEAAMNANGKCEVVRQFARRGLALAALLAIVPFAAGICRAQSSAPSTSAPPTVAASTVAKAPVAPLAAKSPSNTPHEGIAVHGYWTIEVREPDGKVAKHLEFENQLCTTFVDPVTGATVPGGDSTLVNLLDIGQWDAGFFSIILGTPEPPGTVTLPGGGTAPVIPPNCAVTSQFSLAQSGVQEGASALAGSANAGGAPFALTCTGNCFPVLRRSTITSGPAGYIYSGQFTVPAGSPTSTISAVGTDLFTCQGPSFPCGRVPEELAAGCEIDQGTSGSGTLTYFTNCAGLSGNDATIETYPVAGQPGRAPFSGVVLTGTNGVPGPFTVSGGQTIAVTWNLSFQ
jgi:hypothetical protein